MTEKGFVQAQSDNLPMVDFLMVAQFFANNEKFNAAEIRGVKAHRAGRDNYANSAVGYVQLKREGKLCTVLAKVCPEHKVRAKNYTVELEVDEQQNAIVEVNCRDCAASAGGCKHAIALLEWVHKRSEEPAPTEVECYWKKSKLAQVGTTVKFLTLDQLGTKKDFDLPNPSNGAFLRDFIRIGHDKNIPSQVLKYFTKSFNLNRLGLHQLVGEFVKQTEFTEFCEFANNFMTKEDCLAACDATTSQSESKLWHDLRYGRITASRIYEAARCKTAAGSLVESIVGTSKVFETKAMARGKALEKEVISELQKQLKVKLKPVGLLLSPAFPWLGASPDAIADDFVVEVKCPISDNTFGNYIQSGVVAKKFSAQIHLQMFLFEKTKGVFCVADQKLAVICVLLGETFLV